MQRLFLTSFFVFFWAALVLAQGQGLEGDFSTLSAKERSRIAKAEEDGASKDAQYQATMSKAEELFREQRFDEALEQFLAARDMRPYNVYPRVKIQDLQALIARRDAANAAQEEVPGSAIDEPPPQKEGPPRSSTVLSPPDGAQSKPEERPEQHSALPIVDRPKPATSVPDTPSAPPADGERIYKEGRAVVVERNTTVEGKVAVFRKVTHPWGEVMYFKDGAAIPERVWTEVFGTR